jgi:hypothetical protein
MKGWRYEPLFDYFVEQVSWRAICRLSSDESGGGRPKQGERSMDGRDLGRVSKGEEGVVKRRAWIVRRRVEEAVEGQKEAAARDGRT